MNWSLTHWTETSYPANRNFWILLGNQAMTRYADLQVTSHPGLGKSDRVRFCFLGLIRLVQIKPRLELGMQNVARHRPAGGDVVLGGGQSRLHIVDRGHARLGYGAIISAAHREALRDEPLPLFAAAAARHSREAGESAARVAQSRESLAHLGGSTGKFVAHLDAVDGGRRSSMPAIPPTPILRSSGNPPIKLKRAVSPWRESSLSQRLRNLRFSWRQ